MYGRSSIYRGFPELARPVTVPQTASWMPYLVSALDVQHFDTSPHGEDANGRRREGEREKWKEENSMYSLERCE